MQSMTASLACPRCNLPLYPGEAAGVTMSACGHCGGLWLDNRSAQRVQQALPDEALALADRASRFGSGQVDTSHLLACPCCQKALARVNVKAAGVDIDVCSAHGTWFDRHELSAIARALGQLRSRRVGAGMMVAGGVAVAGTAAAAYAVQHQQHQQQAQAALQGGDVADMIETGVDVAGAALDVGDALGTAGRAAMEGADVAGAAVEVASGAGELLASAGEVGGSVLEVTFSVFGAIFECLGSLDL